MASGAEAGGAQGQSVLFVGKTDLPFGDLDAAAVKGWEVRGANTQIFRILFIYGPANFVFGVNRDLGS